MIREAIEKLIRGADLTQEEAAQVMEEIMTGEATPAQFGAFVIGLRLKGETVDEMTGLATVMRDKSLKVDFSGPSVDTCGTGGDDSGHVQHLHNAAAFVVAGRRNSGGQAREPGHDLQERKCRRPGEAGDQDRPWPRGREAVHGGGRYRIYVRAPIPSRHEVRRAADGGRSGSGRCSTSWDL